MAAQTDIKAGQFWLVKPATTPAWPVLICDEEIVETHSVRASSRPKDKLPAMLIGGLKMVWAPRSRLEPLDVGLAIATLDSCVDTQLGHAYEEVVELIGRDSLRYYKDLLFAKQLIGEESAQDEDLAETCTPRGAQRGKAVEASSPPTRMEDDRSDEEDLAAFVAQSKKITKEDRGAATPTAVIPGDMDLQHNQVATTTIALEERKTIGLDPDIVKVYVGNPLAIYTVRRSNLEQSLVLQSTVSFNTSDGYFAMSPLLSRIDPDDFQSVADYLALSEYSPFIVDAGTDHAYLDELAGDAESREEIIRCGILFKIAQQLELPRLQALTLSKFKALQPYPAYEFLVVCGTAFESGLAGDARLDDFLIQYFAGHFQSLVEAEKKLVTQVLDKHPRIKNQLCTVYGSNSSIEPDSTFHRDPTNDDDEGATAR